MRYPCSGSAGTSQQNNWHGGKPSWGETDLLVFGVLTGITLITAFIYSLKKSKKDKGNSITCRECGAPVTNDSRYCTSCGRELN